MIRGGIRLAFAVVLMLGLGSGSAQALSLEQVGQTFIQPIYITSDPSDPNRLFVAEREGRIYLIEGGESKLFAEIGPLVSCCASELGLQSIALSPDFAQSGRFFLFYTGEEEPGEIHVAEMRAVGDGASIATVRNLLTIPHPEHANHYGGQLQFGPEGNLFISTGDGGGGNDVEENAQNLGTLLGKILRIDPDPEGFLQPYGIPAGNPFVSTLGAEPEIWSLGLRNPFRFSFDRQTGDIWIGDVGEAKREEVDFAAAPALGGGANYGWNCYEGLEEGPFTDPGCAGSEPSDFVAPVFDYENPPEDCAAVIGGYVVRGPGLGDLFGRYLYGDLCAGDLRSFSPADPFASDRPEGTHVSSLRSFGEDSCGRLYAVSGDGPVYRILGAEAETCPSPPQATLAPSFVRIRALSRRVKRHRRAFISAWVSPCEGRRGEPVTLWQGRRRMGTRLLDRACSVRFRPRIRHRVTFRAKVPADAVYTEAVSRRLHILILRRHRN